MTRHDTFHPDIRFFSSTSCQWRAPWSNPVDQMEGMSLRSPKVPNRTKAWMMDLRMYKGEVIIPRQPDETNSGSRTDGWTRHSDNIFIPSSTVQRETTCASRGLAFKNVEREHVPFAQESTLGTHRIT
ncbi:hypothetical protein CC1G_15302 [Coprinopsis cinerea okayama7|uniref:Uncharacterized protein n=1 Tax=Coprinopsis cinerea (strain Okayama-7 / 130 / ATCC MYA-4618 / FGSC 9003) TaxID=240176 RepID=D6RPY1_COPC7|nr:hypothetical protein CC1G_15302 [Coprinopsis cinerea okayama7\|eukprot:XP_002910395.1 hypothetical protein CC1G_15302 [Coprinopsis cinerea okayama7\